MWYLIVSVPDHCLSFYFTNAFNRTCLLAINQTLLTPATENVSAFISFLLSELALIFWIYGAFLMV